MKQKIRNTKQIDIRFTTKLYIDNILLLYHTLPKNVHVSVDLNMLPNKFTAINIF